MFIRTIINLSAFVNKYTKLHPLPFPKIEFYIIYWDKSKTWLYTYQQ